MKEGTGIMNLHKTDSWSPEAERGLAGGAWRNRGWVSKGTNFHLGPRGAMYSRGDSSWLHCVGYLKAAEGKS